MRTTKHPFVMLDDDERRKAIEGVPDILAQEAAKDDAFFSTRCCPRCGQGHMTAIVDARTPFQAGRLLPKKLLSCANCDTVIEPFTNITVKEGRTPQDVLNAAALYIHRS